MGVMENSSLTDSQVLGSSCMLSLSSEPPDLRNWFSSYVYESPELDSIENYGDSMSKEREIGEDELTVDKNVGGQGGDLGEFRYFRNMDEEAAEKLPGTWIPLKCTSLKDDLQSQPLGMDSRCSQLLLSEPPDVGNWFSSYVYESPTLNSSQEFGYCESDSISFIAEERNNDIEETLVNVRKSRNGGEGIIGEVDLKATVKCNSNYGDNRLDKQPLNEIHGSLRKNDPSSQQNLFSERTLEQTPKEKSLGTKGISPTKDIQFSILTNEGSQCKLQKKITKENGSPPLLINGGLNDDKKSTVSTDSIQRTDLLRESLQTEVQTQLDCSSARNGAPFVSTNGQSIRKSTNLSNNKENIQKKVSENGFVTASKREFSGVMNKKSVERPKNYNKEIGCAAALPRRALSDKINIKHSDSVEVIGKWSCPQRSKPNLGPPLKQLRLEQWVRKE